MNWEAIAAEFGVFYENMMSMNRTTPNMKFKPFPLITRGQPNWVLCVLVSMDMKRPATQNRRVS